MSAAVSNSPYPMVCAVSVSVGSSATVVLIPGNAPTRERLITSQLMILETLLTALVTGARQVNVDRVEGSNVIQRVQAFSAGDRNGELFYGTHEVSRIATQQQPNGKDSHLEAFLKVIGSNDEVAYNVYDPMLQAVLMAALQTKLEPSGPPTRDQGVVHVKFNGADIATVTLGELVEF